MIDIINRSGNLSGLVYKAPDWQAMAAEQEPVMTAVFDPDYQAAVKENGSGPRLDTSIPGEVTVQEFRQFVTPIIIKPVGTIAITPASVYEDILRMQRAKDAEAGGIFPPWIQENAKVLIIAGIAIIGFSLYMKQKKKGA
jgi:hypothetical protein